MCRSSSGFSSIIVEGENGFLFEPTPDALKEKILFVLSNKKEVDGIKAQTLEFCNGYSLEKFQEMAFQVCAEKLKLTLK